MRIWSRETGSVVPSHTQAESGAYLRDSSRVSRGHPFIYLKLLYAIRPVPSLSGHAIAYRWRSLPRVRRHRGSKPQGSSERVVSWQVIMNQLICASFPHTHHIGMKWAYMMKIYHKNHANLCLRFVFLFLVLCVFSASAWHRKPPQVYLSEVYTPRHAKTSSHSHPQKQSLGLRHNKALGPFIFPRSRKIIPRSWKIKGYRKSKFIFPRSRNFLD